MKKTSKEFNVDEHIEQMVEHRKNVDEAFEKIENALPKNISKVRANELRIGNLVYFKFDNELTIHNIVGKDIQVMHKCERDYNEESECYYPIPLTEDWLVKFGFNQNYGVADSEQYMVYQPIWIYEHERVYYSESYDDYFTFIKTIQYVHQLQNLYFAITGEELTIVE